MPELRDWVSQKFGGTGATLLDESVYSTEDLSKDIIKLEHEQKKIENKMDDHRRQYKALIKEGAEASEMERKKLAQKAKMEKKKLAIQKKKYKSNNVKLGTMLSVQGMREIMDESRDVANLEFDEVMDDAAAHQIESKVVERMSDFGFEMQQIQAIGDALDVPIMDESGMGGVEAQASEEERLMEDMAARDMSEDEIDVESEIDEEVVTGVDVDVGDVDEFEDVDDIDESELEI